MKKFFSALTVLAIFGASFAIQGEAQAQKVYLDVFKAEFPQVEEAAAKKCNVCHEGRSKKNRNVYGKAMAEALGAKKVKDKEKIKASLKAIAEKPSQVEGKTFGELIAEGKLPASEG